MTRYQEVEDHGLGEAPVERGLRVRLGVMARYLHRRLNPGRDMSVSSGDPRRLWWAP